MTFTFSRSDLGSHKTQEVWGIFSPMEALGPFLVVPSLSPYSEALQRMPFKEATPVIRNAVIIGTFVRYICPGKYDHYINSIRARCVDACIAKNNQP